MKTTAINNISSNSRKSTAISIYSPFCLILFLFYIRWGFYLVSVILISLAFAMLGTSSVVYLSENVVRTSLYAVKVTNGQERTVSLMLADKAKVEGLPILAILAPAELKGYIIIEAQTPHVVDELIRGMRHTRERVQGTVSPDEVDHYIEIRPVVEGLEEGTLVEVIAGPFKGMQARIVRVDASKEEVTIEILEAAFTLPITVHADYVREIKGVRE
jgi:transcriptional antiterminator NusG